MTVQGATGGYAPVSWVLFEFLMEVRMNEKRELIDKILVKHIKLLDSFWSNFILTLHLAATGDICSNNIKINESYRYIVNQQHFLK